MHTCPMLCGEFPGEDVALWEAWAAVPPLPQEGVQHLLLWSRATCAQLVSRTPVHPAPSAAHPNGEVGKVCLGMWV